MVKNIIIYFFIYSLLGWIAEVIYCFIIDKEIVNRGFLKGPICPIYGVGAITIILLLKTDLKILLVFFLGAIIASFLEYITSYILEISFKTKWWDYSNEKFNLNGRICLKNSFFFGILSVFLIKIIHPNILKILNYINNDFLSFLTIILLFALIIDIVKSVKALLAINKNVCRFEEFVKQLKKENREKSDYNNEKSCESNIEENISLKNKIKLSHREKSLLKAFPNVIHNKYNESLKKIRKNL